MMTSKANNITESIPELVLHPEFGLKTNFFFITEEVETVWLVSTICNSIVKITSLKYLYGEERAETGGCSLRGLIFIYISAI